MKKLIFVSENWNKQTHATEWLPQKSLHQATKYHPYLICIATITMQYKICNMPITYTTDGDRLAVAVGLMGSEDPADSAF